MPTAWLIQSKRFRYIAMISSLVYCRSSRALMIHSWNFWKVRLMKFVERLVNSIFDNCCVSVLAPPFLPKYTAARIVPRRSIPLCSRKRSSSVAINAFTTLGLMRS